MEDLQIENKKRWYKKWWGILLILTVIIVLLSLLLFFLQVLDYMGKIKRGEVIASQMTGEEISLSDETLEFDEIVTNDDPSVGDLDSKIVIVEFSDFRCPRCLQAFPIVREIISLYSDQIRYIYRDFPATDEISFIAAQAAECADDQGKFWPMHDKLFQNQDSLSLENIKILAQHVGLDEQQFNYCLDSGKYDQEVRKDLADGIRAGVPGTPTFFINGFAVPGVIPLKDFKRIIDLSLEENN